MQIGDIIVNPYVEAKTDGIPNKDHMGMVVRVGEKYTTALLNTGDTVKYLTDHARQWDVVNHVDLLKLIKKK